MSTLDLVLGNVAAWSVQVAVLGVAAAILSRLVPIERPAVRLAFGQGLLALVLGLPLLQPWRASAGEVSWLFAPEPSAAATWAGTLGPGAGAPPSWSLAAAALLVLGAALRLGLVVGGLLRLRALRRLARPVLAPPWLLALRDEVAPRASLVRCGGTGTPATFGIRRPVVLLPPAFESMGRDRQQAVALHELLHARRGDWPFLFGEELLKAALFF
ncbi:MAG TPA: M56 family metallopeptidase, partial [Vicinamibacteria bacterium]